MVMMMMMMNVIDSRRWYDGSDRIKITCFRALFTSVDTLEY